MKRLEILENEEKIEKEEIMKNQQEQEKERELFARERESRQGKVVNAKLEGSDFDSLDGQEHKQQGNNIIFEESDEPNHEIINKMNKNLGIEGSCSNPLAFEKKSIKTESVKAEEVDKSISEDEILFKRQKQRYFEDNSNVKCFKCGKKGHFQSMCPNRSKVI